MTTQNSKLKAIVSIRNLVIGISTDWKDLRSFGTDIDDLIHSVSSTFINHAPTIAHERWLLEIGKIEENIQSLKSIMNQVIKQINSRDSRELVEIWNQNQQYSIDLLSRLNNLNALGKVHLPENQQKNWKVQWQLILDKFVAIQELVEGSGIHLKMITEYTPEEVDELTHTILCHMPTKYTMEEALQYEKEYMEAYEQLKAETSQKKNLWDRFLDILAGGVQQTPAERVMMQRWVNGEKGEL